MSRRAVVLWFSCLSWLAAASVVASVVASPAQAYELRLVQATPVGLQESFSLYLDTEGASDIVLFSVSVTFDPYTMQ